MQYCGGVEAELGRGIVEPPTRRKRGYDDTTNALIEPSEHSLPIDGSGDWVDVKLCIIARLKASFQCIERIDQEIYSKCSDCAGLSRNS